MVRRIGLTGGIATGKSTVSAYLKHLGYTVLDSDQFAHEAYADPEVFVKLKQSFPTCIQRDGAIDRLQLGKLVFAQESQKAILENIIHPYVKQRLRQGIQENINQKIVFLDIPLLFEAHMENFCDEIWVVNLALDAQLARLQKRNHLTPQDALTRMKNQWPMTEKCAKADIVIDNNGDLKALYAQVDQLLEAYKDDQAE